MSQLLAESWLGSFNTSKMCDLSMSLPQNAITGNITFRRKKRKAGYLRLAIEKPWERHSRHWSLPKTEGSGPSEVSFAPDRNFATWRLKWCRCRGRYYQVSRLHLASRSGGLTLSIRPWILWNDGHNFGVIDDTSCLKHGIYLNAWRALLTDRPTTCEAHKCKRTWMILDVLGWHMMTLEAGRGWRVDVCINQVGWRPSTSEFASSSSLLWSSSLHTGSPNWPS